MRSGVVVGCDFAHSAVDRQETGHAGKASYPVVPAQKRRRKKQVIQARQQLPEPQNRRWEAVTTTILAVDSAYEKRGRLTYEKASRSKLSNNEHLAARTEQLHKVLPLGWKRTDPLASGWTDRWWPSTTSTTPSI